MLKNYCSEPRLSLLDIKIDTTKILEKSDKNASIYKTAYSNPFTNEILQKLN